MNSEPQMYENPLDTRNARAYKFKTIPYVSVLLFGPHAHTTHDKHNRMHPLYLCSVLKCARMRNK